MIKSLVWSDTDSRVSFNDFDFVEALHVNRLVNLKAKTPGVALSESIADYFTTDAQTIAKRNSLFVDLVSDNSLFRQLDKCFAELSDFFEIRQERESYPGNEQLLYSAKELELYIGFLTDINSVLESHSSVGESLLALRLEIQSVVESDSFKTLSSELSKHGNTVRNIKSVLIGVNLNASLAPIEAGLVSVHEEAFVSGDFINKLLRLDFKSTAFSCSAPLVPLSGQLTPQELAALKSGVNSSLNKVLHKSLSAWNTATKKYVKSNLEFLSVISREWRFVSACVHALSELKEAGFSLTVPKLSQAESINGLYHSLFALSAGGRKIIKNDLNFNDENGFYILTGPNQGGKSIYLQSVGLLYSMLHLGMLLPADEAYICPVNGIYTHFVDKTKSDFHHGRLDAECDKIHKINGKLKQNSIILFDEPFSGTNGEEGAVLCAEVIRAYSEIGARGICATHNFRLCELEVENSESNKSKIRNISARLDSSRHERLFRIVAGACDKSYASDIAEKYKLSSENIVEAFNNREA